MGALIVGIYAVAPGFFLGGLHASRGTEIVDHVVPGMAVLATVYVVILWGGPRVNRRAGLVILLAGLWMAIFHVKVLRSAFDHQARWVPVLYHCSTALLVLLLGIEWRWFCRPAPPEDDLDELLDDEDDREAVQQVG